MIKEEVAGYDEPDLEACGPIKKWILKRTRALKGI
jgi:hypothetical protein